MILTLATGGSHAAEGIEPDPESSDMVALDAPGDPHEEGGPDDPPQPYTCLQCGRGFAQVTD